MTASNITPTIYGGRAETDGNSRRGDTYTPSERGARDLRFTASIVVPGSAAPLNTLRSGGCFSFYARINTHPVAMETMASADAPRSCTERPLLDAADECEPFRLTRITFGAFMQTGLDGRCGRFPRRGATVAAESTAAPGVDCGSPREGVADRERCSVHRKSPLCVRLRLCAVARSLYAGAVFLHCLQTGEVFASLCGAVEVGEDAPNACSGLAFGALPTLLPPLSPVGGVVLSTFCAMRCRWQQRVGNSVAFLADRWFYVERCSGQSARRDFNAPEVLVGQRKKIPGRASVGWQGPTGGTGPGASCIRLGVYL